MAYSIGEVARLLGLTTQAIRFYESKGLISPEKDPESNYRTFETWELDSLMHIRLLRALEFNIDDIKDILHYHNTSTVLEEYKAHAVEFEKKLAHANILLACLQREIVELEEYAKYGTTQVFEDLREEFFALYPDEQEDDNQRRKAVKLMTTWVQKAPFVIGSIKLYANGKYRFGPSVLKSYRQYLPGTDSAIVEHIPEALGYSFFIKFSPQDGFHAKEIFQAIQQYFGNMPKEPIYARNLYTTGRKKPIETIYKIWVPKTD